MTTASLKPFTVREGHVTLRVWPARQLPALWEFEYVDPEHGRRRIKRAKRSDAEAEARQIAERLARGQFVVKGRQAADYAEADLLATKWNRSVAELARVADRWLASQQQIAPQHSTLSIVQELLREVQASRRALHHRDLRLRLGRFEREVKCPLAELTPAGVESWLNAIQAGGRNRVNYLSALSNLIGFARARGYVPENFDPLKSIKRPRKVNVGVSSKVYSVTDLQRLLAHVAPSALPAVAIGAFAGLRPSEVLKLHWRDVDWESGHIIVPDDTKTGRRLAPLLPNLRAWLEPLKDSGRIVPMGWSGLGQSLRRACRKINASLEADGSPGRVELKADGFRHSFVSYRCAETRNLHLVSDECGHSVTVLKKVYREIVTPRAAKEWFNLMPETGAETNSVRLFDAKTSPLLPLCQQPVAVSG